MNVYDYDLPELSFTDAELKHYEYLENFIIILDSLIKSRDGNMMAYIVALSNQLSRDEFNFIIKYVALHFKP